MDLDLFASIRREEAKVGPVLPPDDIDIWCQQLVNRWVYLKHQRPDALIELRNLIAAAKARP